MTTLFIIKFGSDGLEEYSFEIFAPIGSHGKENENKSLKIWQLKILKKEKTGFEIWWRGSYPQSLAWIHVAVS